MQFGQLKFQWNLDPSFVSLTLSPITYFFFEEPFRYWWCTVPHSHVLNQKLSSSHFIAQSLSLSLTCNQSHWQNLLCCDTHTLPVPFYQIFDIYLAPPIFTIFHFFWLAHLNAAVHYRVCSCTFITIFPAHNDAYSSINSSLSEFLFLSLSNSH